MIRKLAEEDDLPKPSPGKAAADVAAAFTVLTYVRQDIASSPRIAILDDFRTNPAVLQLFEQAVRERGSPEAQVSVQ